MDAVTVKQFLAKLDPSQDGHWTSQGLPRMDVLVSFGLTIERRDLNELVPGFSRAVAREQASANPPDPEPASATADEEDYFARTNRNIAERAKRRKAALEHLAAGGFTLKDLEPVRSKLDLGIRQRNRAARRELQS